MTLLTQIGNRIMHILYLVVPLCALLVEHVFDAIGEILTVFCAGGVCIPSSDSYLFFLEGSRCPCQHPFPHFLAAWFDKRENYLSLPYYSVPSTKIRSGTLHYTRFS